MTPRLLPRPRSVPIAALAAVLPGLAAAQSAPVVLDDILVSAGRTPVAATATGRSHTVITGEELERRDIRRVADALRTVPGLAVTRVGGVGGTTAVRIRGADSNQVLVLIDGVEVSSVGNGEYDFGGLIAADIERIEVLRGAQSALYGSNAAAGVVSIFTRGAVRGETASRFHAEGGSDGTLAGSATFLHGAETWDLALSAALRRTEGFDISTAGDGEKDGDRNVTLNARGSWDVGEALTLGATARFTDRESEFDGFASFGPQTGQVIDEDSRTDQTEVFLSTFARALAFDDRLSSELRFEYTDVVSSSLTEDVETFKTDGRRYHLSGQTSYAFDLPEAASSHVLTAAVEYEREVNVAQTRDFFAFPPAVIDSVTQTREILGLVGEWRGSFLDRLDLQAGVRQDFNDTFADAFTWSASASYRLPETGTRLHAQAGKGVTNPTFIEQFGFFPDLFVGNPDLEPESTLGWDIGVEQSLLEGRLVLDATYFRARVTDQIVDGFDPAAGLPTSVNAPGESTREGVELTARARPVEGLTLTAAYTWTLAQTPDGLQETRRPRHAASLIADYRFDQDRAGVNLTLSYQGDRRDLDFTTGRFPAPLTTLDGYVLVGIGGSYDLGEGVELYGRVENATDTDYEEVFNFSTQGIAGYAGVRLRF